MLLYATNAVCALAGLLFLIIGVRRLREWRLLAGGVHGLVGAGFLLARPLNPAGRDAVAGWR